MKNTTQKSRIPLADLQSGQIWHMADSELHVGDVGKLLVYYKLFRGGAKKTNKSLSAKKVVEDYLKEQKAVLA